MRQKRSRHYRFALGFISIAVLLIAVSTGLGAKKGGKPQWEWTVAISADLTHDNDLHLYSDGNGEYQATGNVHVRVYRESKNLYRFRLRIENGSTRKIELRNVMLDPAWVDTSEGAGYFPIRGSCADPDFCEDSDECTEVLADFLNRLHPDCDYTRVNIDITVSLDIESMELNVPQLLNNEFVGIYMLRTTDILRNPDDDSHNMDAQNLPAPIGHNNRFSPIYIERTGPNTWRIWADWDGAYMNYAEFYYGFFRGRQWEYKIPMAADGPFNFQMTWTRSLVGN